MKAYLKPFAVGVLGVFVALVSWHLWLDHKALHAIIGHINAQARQGAQK